MGFVMTLVRSEFGQGDQSRAADGKHREHQNTVKDVVVDQSCDDQFEQQEDTPLLEDPFFFALEIEG